MGTLSGDFKGLCLTTRVFFRPFGDPVWYIGNLAEHRRCSHASRQPWVGVFDKSYDEALALTRETYRVLSRIEQNECRAASPVDDLRLRGEAFRLTTRLMQVIAWLLTQRAVHAGELTAKEVSSNAQYRLGATKICGDDSQHHHPTIPDEFADLLDRSLNLYMRIARLDDLLHASVH